MQGQTVFFQNKPRIIATGTIAGPKEAEGVVGKYADKALNDDMYGEDTYEKAECKMLTYAVRRSIQNARLEEKDIDLLISGDLLNQIISASFTARDFDFPFLGTYSACATLAEAFALAALFVNDGHADRVVAATGSHFSSAERQYRYPLELGNTRPPQSQWTVTGAGSAVIVRGNFCKTPPQKKTKGVDYEGKIAITSATFGRVVDFGVTDVNNMGAAMAPAACDTITRHFKDTGKKPSDYDLILTGDLGALGSRILKHLTKQKGVDIQKNHVDCGEIVYKVIEDEFQGGSGAGCSAVVFNSYIFDKLKKREINSVLLCATGALLSTVSAGQGESIPCICHAVAIENE
ncbi:MAG: stage V sporulation protein AD [Clostridia bacterium]|nr:stage V sporulation protein AD [Clostridia bacterium]